MALLRRNGTGRGPAARLAGAAALVSCAGCALWTAIAGPGELVFSHDLHVTEEQLDCASCHENAYVDPDPGMPASDTCASCHVEVDSGKPPERMVATLFDGEAYRARRASALDDEVRFDHLRHVDAIDDCDACHRGIAENAAVDAGVAVAMDDCVRCHAGNAAPDDCAGCHAEVGTDWPPPSHAHEWTRLHGRASRRVDPRAADDCGLCHEESTCARCHLVEPPRDHDAHFRLRGHALFARVDRSRCAACHETATCERCHAEVLPLSHASGVWGGTRSTHCISCHLPLDAAGCSTCHRGTPSHTLAPPKPAWHDAAMNCRGCHGAGQPLLHVDDGTNCNLCHA